ncbi:hypothetical protein HY095_05235 [Candidatus Micrarchaeota archaeon]|nr:hypothetical protein [Candidatus Micrarchaeota archaeon]
MAVFNVSTIGNMRPNKRVVLAVFLLSGFILLIAVMLFSFELTQRGQFSGFHSFLVTYHLEIMVVISAIGVAVGAGVFYLMSERVEKTEKESKITATLLLSLLSVEERRAVEFLAKSGGNALQSEVSRLEGMNRLKAHRTVGRLVSKEIVAITKVGKTNRLQLSPAILDALKSKA